MVKPPPFGGVNWDFVIDLNRISIYPRFIKFPYSNVFVPVGTVAQYFSSFRTITCQLAYDSYSKHQ